MIVSQILSDDGESLAGLGIMLPGSKTVRPELGPVRPRLPWKGTIDTPLEPAIRNQTDHFSLAIDAIDRMPRFRVTGSSVRKALPYSPARTTSQRRGASSIRW